jgi:hypothetical protein
VSSLCSCGSLAYPDNEWAKQLFYTLDDHVWGMKITVLEESVDFATLETEKLFSQLKSHELPINIILTMMFLLLVRLLLLVIVLVVMMLTPLKDWRRRLEEGEWEPIKILRRNSVYVPKLTQRHSVLTRPKPHSYRKTISLRTGLETIAETQIDVGKNLC